jgi:hypothetical protein
LGFRVKTSFQVHGAILNYCLFSPSFSYRDFYRSERNGRGRSALPSRREEDIHISEGNVAIEDPSAREEEEDIDISDIVSLTGSLDTNIMVNLDNYNEESDINLEWDRGNYL